MRRLLLGGVLLVCACSKANDAKTAAVMGDSLPPGHVPIDQPPNAGAALSALGQALVDSGNTAFRVKDYDGALAFYRKASQSDPSHAAPWFGTYMVGQAMKNTALADSALAMVRARAPEMQSHPGATTPLPPGVMPTTPSPYSPHGEVKKPGSTS